MDVENFSFFFIAVDVVQVDIYGVFFWFWKMMVLNATKQNKTKKEYKFMGNWFFVWG